MGRLRLYVGRMGVLKYVGNAGVFVGRICVGGGRMGLYLCG